MARETLAGFRRQVAALQSQLAEEQEKGSRWQLKHKQEAEKTKSAESSNGALRMHVVSLQRQAEQMRGFIRAHHTTTTVPTPTYAGEIVYPQETWPFMDADLG